MKKHFIALVQSVPQLIARSADDSRSTPSIDVTIAVLEEEENEKKSPRNWRLEHKERSCGGCRAMLHAYQPSSSTDPTVIFGWNGPDISHGSLRDYVHGTAACRTIQRKLDALYRANGPCVDAAASLARWLQVCGVTGKSVWVRPEGNRESWLNRGEWNVLTVEEFVELVRSKFPVVKSCPKCGKPMAQDDGHLCGDCWKEANRESGHLLMEALAQ